MVKRFNLVHLTRRSLTSESRLNKYRKRGFHIAVPTPDRSKEHPTVILVKQGAVDGLAKLTQAKAEQDCSEARERGTGQGGRVGLQQHSSSVGPALGQLPHP